MQICNYDSCTACGACLNACTHKSIFFQEDEWGENHPVIDEGKCVNCGLCQKVCPNNSGPAYYYPSHCYAAWITDKEKRSICASGGLGTIMSEYVIREKKGVVFGTTYDSCLNPITTYAETLDGIEYFKGSKYVQSLINDDVFRKIKAFLQQGRFVLYIATPCQIAGMKSYLRKDYSNLITVDLICHGVCPSSYLQNEVNRLRKRYNLRDITNIRFRGNDGNNYRLTLWNKDKRKLFPGKQLSKIISLDYEKQQYYLSGFLLGISMRESCYSCRYARPERVSDVTIGDFIGLGKTLPWAYNVKNVSSVTTNTEQGVIFYQQLCKSMNELESHERPYEERLAYRPSMVEPFPRHTLNEKFRNLYKEHGYDYAIHEVLKDCIDQRVKDKRKQQLLIPYTLTRKMGGLILRLIRNSIIRNT